MIHYTEILSDFAFGLKYGDLPRGTVENTKKVILDWYSSAFAGMRVNRDFNAVVRSVWLGGGERSASVLCGKEKLYSETDAAFMNAVYAHGADMDDGNRLSMGHIAASVISAVFAVAESDGRKNAANYRGEEVIVAINTGYEIFNRIGAAAQPGLVKRGFHSTGTAGGMACAAAVAKLIGLDSDGIYRAISLAAVQSSGLIVIAESGQSVKPLNPANAARIGILSARMAEKGAVAPRFPLESEKGWFHAMTDCVNEGRITDGLGRRFTVDEGYLKPYPSCRHTHAPIECALRLRAVFMENYRVIPIDEIDTVEIYPYENAVRIAGQIDLPRVDEDTKFSIKYAVAYALVNGSFGLDALTVDAVTEEASRIAERIRFVIDPDMEQGDKGIRGATVSVTMRDGGTVSETVLIPKGDAAAPFSREDAMAKLYACSDGIISREDADRLAKWVDEFEKNTFDSVNRAFEF